MSSKLKQCFIFLFVIVLLNTLTVFYVQSVGDSLQSLYINVYSELIVFSTIIPVYLLVISGNVRDYKNELLILRYGMRKYMSGKLVQRIVFISMIYACLILFNMSISKYLLTNRIIKNELLYIIFSLVVWMELFIIIGIIYTIIYFKYKHIVLATGITLLVLYVFDFFKRLLRYSSSFSMTNLFNMSFFINDNGMSILKILAYVSDMLLIILLLFYLLKKVMRRIDFM